MSALHEYQNYVPQIAKDVFIAAGAHVIGNVVIGAESSLWFNTVVRGDVNWIKIGERTNIQDLSMIHVDSAGWPTNIGDDVTVGHRVILHGCEIGNRVLVGMGAIVMNNVKIGEDSIIGAGALLTEGTIIPPKTLALGSPCKVKRELSDNEIQMIKLSALHYAELAQTYLKASQK